MSAEYGLLLWSFGMLGSFAVVFAYHTGWQRGYEERMREERDEEWEARKNE